MRFSRSQPSSPLGLDITKPRANIYTNRRVIFLGSSILLFTFLLILSPSHWKHSISHNDALTRNIPLVSTWKTYNHDKLIANGTLGFEKIYVIGLSDRTDRRDSMEIAADVTNLKLEWQEGTLTKDINQKVIPPTYKLPNVLPGVVGCWRSHMNLIRKIVREKTTSALILEDDADWDIRIVEQMQRFATATKTLLSDGQTQPGLQHTGSPYGEGWDILWIGHCGGFHGNTSSVPHYIIRDDETVPPYFAMDDMNFDVSPYRKWGQKPEGEPTCAAHAGRDPKGKVCDSPRLLPTDRIVQERAKPVCTAGYAISLQGARKLLARTGGLSLTDVFAPVDQGFGDVCAGSTDLPGERTRCFTPSPPYFRGYKAKGMQVGDSDIRPTGTNGEKRTVGWSKGIMQSVRLNANWVISGMRDGGGAETQYIKLTDGTWRLREAHEYRHYKPDVKVDHWIW